MGTNTRKRYSNEFKEQAIKRLMNGEYTIKEVSSSLGVSYSVLQSWKREFMKKKKQQPEKDQLEEKYKALLKENKRLAEENHIFKRFAEILALEQKKN